MKMEKEEEEEEKEEEEEEKEEEEEFFGLVLLQCFLWHYEPCWSSKCSEVSCTLLKGLCVDRLSIVIYFVSALSRHTESTDSMIHFPKETKLKYGHYTVISAHLICNVT